MRNRSEHLESGEIDGSYPSTLDYVGQRLAHYVSFH